VLLKMTNFTILSNFLVVSFFLVLMSIAMSSAEQDYTILIWSVVLDVFLDFINIYLHFKSSDSHLQRFHELVPESFRMMAVIFFFLCRYEGSFKHIFVYLTLVYSVSVLYRLVSCTKYGKIRYLGVS
jgi:hypothetical protein